MKKIIFYLLLSLILSVPATAGMVRSLNSTYAFVDPEFNSAEFIKIEFLYATGGKHRAVIWYYPVDANGTRYGDLRRVQVFDRDDDPETPENEASTGFTDFVAGYATTLSSRTDAIVEADIATDFAQVIP